MEVETGGGGAVEPGTGGGGGAVLPGTGGDTLARTVETEESGMMRSGWVFFS